MEEKKSNISKTIYSRIYYGWNDDECIKGKGVTHVKNT